jgi:hypothetical protein
MKNQIWNNRVPIQCRLKLWWDRLWVRKNEFHKSLSLDEDLLEHMCECEQRRYSADLSRRRMIAHNRTLEKSDL